MDTPFSRGETPGAQDAESLDRLRARVAQLEDGLAEATQASDQLRRVLADERVQLGRSFELFERDRRLIGFEIHDGIVQDLTAALMYLQAGVAELTRDGGAPPAAVVSCERLIGRCIDEARRLMNGLQPPLLGELGLRPALHALAAEVRERGVPDVVLDIDPALGTLAPPLEVAVYRIVQESLNNVWQHGRAARAAVSIQLRGGQIEIEVSDQGIGFSTTDAKTHGYGLIGIRERAQMFGGQATIASEPGQGTTVRATLPLG